MSDENENKNQIFALQKIIQELRIDKDKLEGQEKILRSKIN